MISYYKDCLYVQVFLTYKLKYILDNYFLIFNYSLYFGSYNLLIICIIITFSNCLRPFFCLVANLYCKYFLSLQL